MDTSGERHAASRSDHQVPRRYRRRHHPRRGRPPLPLRRNEIVNKGSDLVGSEVDFLVVSRQPKQIFLMAGSPWTAFGGNA